MKARDLIKLGLKPGPAIGVAMRLLPDAQKALGAKVLRRDVEALVREPNAYKDHPHWALLAQAVMEQDGRRATFVERESAAPYRVWGEGLEAGAVDQMKNAARLPVAVAGALMPDAHQGYGLPIGGVLATDNTVIPYAVGVDIACRMKLSVLDIPAADLKRLNDTLKNALNRETVFGAGGKLKRPAYHEVLDADWNVTPITRRLLDTKAREQLGTSGSGNHFVEFGTLRVDASSQGFDLPPGEYLALLSHSGSRG